MLPENSFVAGGWSVVPRPIRVAVVGTICVQSSGPVANWIKQLIAERAASKRPRRRGMPNRKAKTQGGPVDLANRVKLANGILIPLLTQALELQYMAGVAHRRGFRAALQTKFDKAAKLARAGLTDIAIDDVASAKKRLKALDAAV